MNEDEFAIDTLSFGCLTGVLSRFDVRSADLGEVSVGVLNVLRIDALFAWKCRKFFRSLLLDSLFIR